ncbi:MAG: POTRA domain-containing protein, partial [Casimicrobiaceae bacterium]
MRAVLLPPAPRTRVVGAWWLALTFATLAASPSSANAQGPAPAGPVVSRPRADAVVRFTVNVDAPSAVAAAVTSGVDLIRWQDFAEMTEDLFERLSAQAVSQAAEAAATQGFFSAKVDVAVDRNKQPVEVTITVTPGLLTTISDVRINVDGPATGSVQGNAVIARVREEWLLPQGVAFNQRTWTAAKDNSVRTLAANAYVAAQMTESEATVDPDARSAELSVT